MFRRRLESNGQKGLFGEKIGSTSLQREEDFHGIRNRRKFD
jgi:hypothetical protein